MELDSYSIEFLKSGLSVNTHVGCGLGCKYCVLTTGVTGFPNKSIYINSPQHIIERLNNSQTLFVNGLTPIYVNNRTDPFLPNVKASTYEVLGLFIEHHIISPIIVISKLPPDERFHDLASRLNILYFYTYSGLTGIDYNSDCSINERSLEIIVKNVPFKNRFHYFRPVIPGYNDSEDAVCGVMKTIKGIFRLTVSGGIRLNNENSKRFGVLEYDKNHKLFTNNVWSMINERAKLFQIPVVRHTSCAIAIFMNRTNNLHYIDKEAHCIGSTCACYELCKQKSILNIDVIDEHLKSIPNIKYRWTENEILKFDSPVSQEIIAFLKSTFGVNCIAEEIILSASESQITK